MIILGKFGDLTMPKVDRRILKSQEAIKKALIELMAKNNFDDITIQDIADRANVNRGTIYLHYLALQRKFRDYPVDMCSSRFFLCER